MKETGVIRRLDELGRVVIPIEIRKRLKILNGDSVDIFIENDKIILKKYQPMTYDILHIKTLIDIYKEQYNCDYILFDNHKIIYTTLLNISFKDKIINSINDFLDYDININRIFNTDLNLLINIRRISIDNELGYIGVLSSVLLNKHKETLDLLTKYILNIN